MLIRCWFTAARVAIVIVSINSCVWRGEKPLFYCRGSTLRVRFQNGCLSWQWPRGWRSTIDVVTCDSRGKRWPGAIVRIWGVVKARRNLPNLPISVVGPMRSIRSRIAVRGESGHRPLRFSPSTHGVIPSPLSVKTSRGVASRGIRLGVRVPSRSRPRARSE